MGSVTIRRLDVPPAFNAASVAKLRGDIATALSGGGAAPLVFAGSAEVFCAGLDFGAMAEPASDIHALTASLAELLLAVRLACVPTIALVRGAATGGGVGFAAACDVIIAADDASFSLTELLFGLTPAIILPLLGERLRPQILRRRALSGARWGAAAALADGLADEIAPREDLQAAGERWARQLRRPRSETVAAWKTMTAVRGDIADAVREGARATAAALDDAQIRDRLVAFHRDGVVPWA